MFDMLILPLDRLVSSRVRGLLSPFFTIIFVGILNLSIRRVADEVNSMQSVYATIATAAPPKSV